MASFFTAFFAFAMLICLASAHNITRLLAEYPEFGLFNSLLSQSKVADDINIRQTITVLVTDNSSASAFSSLDADTLKKALSVHVILDYYDAAKLDKVAKKSALLTTLFQSSGVANDRMGFLNYTRRQADGKELFGSAQPGAPLSSELLQIVATRPYNLSVIQVSTAIIPPGLGGNPQEVPIAPATPPPAGAPEEAPAPAPADAPAADSPDDSADAPTPDADAPAADSPDADAPTADSPDADAPTADSPVKSKSADSPAEGDADQSKAEKAVVGSVSIFGTLVLLGAIL